MARKEPSYCSMPVNSLLFLFLFLPVTLFFASIVSDRLKNPFLLAASWIFYAWGGVSYTSILIGSTLVNYMAGLALDHARGARSRKAWLVAGILLNLLPLVIFKYTGFLRDNINILIALFNGSPLVIRNLILPLGISFYSFKAITYLVSVYRKECAAQRNFTDLALYISFFPSVLAGPIDRYVHFLPQLHGRKVTVEKFSSGIRRFVIGLGKKVLIANSLSLVTDQLFGYPVSGLTTPLAWLALFCYSLQIYYDFSGYTDMAIGLGRMFGFELTENFNFPYISRSIKEFWKRWHISLSTWLRDYIFLPLAYSSSRKMKKNRYLGLRTDHVLYMIATSVTFLVCGFWHGAAWNFVIWGLLHGLLLILEQLGLGKIVRHLYRPVQHLYAVFLLMITWVFFRTSSPADAFQFIGILFGAGGKPVEWTVVREFINPGLIVTVLIAVAGSTRIFYLVLRRMNRKLEDPRILVRGFSVNLIGIGT
ncbi:MAG TPA: MBOAT family O-acyltransferase, partial [Bacteroidales bacterium]|nr:MBOAT family O-acyltransferase [Bacteroidales bacterium]